MKREKAGGFAGRCLFWLAAAALTACCIGQLGQLYYVFGWFSHFVPHYAVVFALAVCFVRKGRMLWCCCLAVSLCWLLQPWSEWRDGGMSAAVGRPFSVLWYNVHADNPDLAAEQAFILSRQADVVALAESDAAGSEWQQLRAVYPYGCWHSERGPFALALRSQRPLDGCEVVLSDGIPYIRAVSGGLVLYVLHAPPPLTAELADLQQDYLYRAAAAAAQEHDVLLVGDLNAAPFSPLWRDFAEQGGLAAYTPYYLPTWRPFFLNIDHVMGRSAKGVYWHVRPLSWQYSDHRALLAETDWDGR